MRRMTYFVMALALVLGFTQCKKEQPATPQNGQVRITLNVTNGNSNGAKAEVDPPHVNFVSGDQILVGYDGVYVGALTHNGNQFEGSINATQNGNQPLYFYFVGNKNKTGASISVGDESYTVDISDQTTELPVISMAPSNEYYPSEGNAYSASLHNKCALVKFTLASGTTDAVAVGGMMTKATIDFANPGVVTPSTAGEITLHTGASTNEKWAILLAQDAVDDALVAVGYYGYTVDIPEIEDNAFAPQFDAINNSEASNLIVLNRLTNDYTATNGQVLTGTLANNVKISIAAGDTVTLGGVSINANGAWTSGNYAGITCEGNATIILKDETTNTVKGFYQNYPGIHVPENYTLTIKGDGQLTANNSNGAGIGGGLGISCGNILIEGGDINATGGYGASGIGGAYYGQCGNITISGGTVTANGGEEAAGIGGATSCGTITISDGTIVATGGGRAAGIGSGANGSCGAITISGDTVTAKGGLGASGIGSGLNGSCEDITISGGTVTATGGEDAAGIGSGYEAYCGYITITNGVTQVTATKGADIADFGSDNYYSIGAGAGYNSTCGTVTIGGTVYWDGSSYQNGGASYLAQGQIIYPSQGPAPSVPTNVTWDNENVFNASNVDNKVASWNPFAVFADIVIGLIGNSSSFTPYDEYQHNSSLMVYGNYGDYFTFTAPSGKKFTKIEIIDNGSINFTAYDGAWTQPANNKIEWNGTAANEVTLGGSERIFCYDLNSIVFTLVDE